MVVPMRRLYFLLICLALMQASPALGKARSINSTAVENATLDEARKREPNPALVKAQILLDRLRFSPGAIDGRRGNNTRLALQTFQQANHLKATGELDQQSWDALTGTDSEPLLQDYEITKDDVAGPFVKVPEQMEEQAKLKKLAYSSPLELLSEKFHVDEELLTALNEGKDFEQAGTRITVPKVRAGKLGKVERIEVDKEQKAVRAYDKDGQLLAHYPATVGSEARPAPTGSFKVTKVARNPLYTYEPKNQFKGVEADQPFDIAPGPNNPVGTVWIEINKDGYGLHGTPEPSQIGKTASHGCVRLTNWDAEDLASGVTKGDPVEFNETS